MHSHYLKAIGLLLALVSGGTASGDESRTCPVDPTASCAGDTSPTARQDSVPGQGDLPVFLAMEEHRLRQELPADEIPGLRIGWNVGQPFQDFMDGLEGQKPLVLLFTSANCSFCNRLIEKFSCPELNAFAGRAIFSVSLPQSNTEARQLFDAVEAASYPTMVVLRPDPNTIHVLGQAVGELAVGQAVDFLTNAFDAYYAAAKVPKPATPLLSPEEMKSAYETRGLPWSPPETCRE